jgi:hypothetical protein
MSAKTKFSPRGFFHVKHLNKNGELIGVYKMPNGIVDVGMDMILETMFRAGAQSTTWYIGLVDNAGFTAFNDADTMASHAGWGANGDYVAATRPQWAVNAATGRQITNSSTVDFDINASGTLKGIFIPNENTKGGTSGTLWATASFSATVSVQNGDTLKVTYTVSG